MTKSITCWDKVLNYTDNMVNAVQPDWTVRDLLITDMK